LAVFVQMQPVLCIGAKKVTIVVWLQNKINGFIIVATFQTPIYIYDVNDCYCISWLMVRKSNSAVFLYYLQDNTSIVKHYIITIIV